MLVAWLATVPCVVTLAVRIVALCTFWKMRLSTLPSLPFSIKFLICIAPAPVDLKDALVWVLSNCAWRRSIAKVSSHLLLLPGK
jgi:hypothetical protein